MSMDDRTRIHPGRTETGVGTQLSGIYELDERIASGGMGEVYRGHNIQTGDLVAIKIVLPEFARDPTILSLFRKEASILNHLSHEAVVRYHVFTVDPTIGRPYLAMEYVDGQSLFDTLRQGAMAPDDVLRLCHRLASGLSAVHRAGAIHRDLSPDNVILPGGNVERAKIIDFGIARSARVGGETLIGGRFAGKYNYVSPEQLGLFGGEVSERSDIYSLGLVLAAALRGRPLDMTGSQVDVVEKRRSVPDLAGIDGEMRPIIEAMLQPDPDERPASMAEIVRMCREAADTEEEWDEETLATRPWVGLGRRDAEHAGSGEERQARFVEHVRPAHLSKPRAAPAKLPSRQQRRQGMSGGAIAGLILTLVVAAGAGAYFTGYLPLGSAPIASEEGQAALVPDRAPKLKEMASAEPAATPARRPVQVPVPREPAKSLPAPSNVEQARPAPAPPAGQPHEAAVTGKPADNAASGTNLPASEIIKQLLEQTRKNAAATGAGGTKQDAPAPAKAASPEPRENTAAAVSPPPQAIPAAKPAPVSQAVAPSQAGGQESSSQNVQSAIEKELPGWTRLPPPEPQPDAAGSPSDPAMKPVKEEDAASPSAPEKTAQASPPVAPQAAEPSDVVASASPAAEATPDAPKGAKSATAPVQAPPIPQATLPPLPAPLQPPKTDSNAGANTQQTAAPPAMPPATPAEAPAPMAKIPPPQPLQPAAEPAVEGVEPNSGQGGGAVVAMSVPKPTAPPPPVNPLEKTVSWLRAYPGGDCFYAAPDDAGGSSVGIVGFGTTPDSFMKLMKAFEGRFGSEPDVQVRLISPAQCEVTRFLRGFAIPAADIQTLSLDRTSVPDGSPISGVLRTQGGLRSNLLLIDHDGMTYNLDRLLVVDGDTAKFNARIKLDTGSRAKGKPMPEIVLAITGPVDLRSASTLQSAPASEVLPKIREEMRQSGGEFSATAKYFQLGG